MYIYRVIHEACSSTFFQFNNEFIEILINILKEKIFKLLRLLEVPKDT